MIELYLFLVKSESFTTFAISGVKVPPHFRSQEQKFHDIFAPGSGSSIYGTMELFLSGT